MHSSQTILSTLLAIFCLFNCASSNPEQRDIDPKKMICGLSFVAPPQPFQENPFIDIQSVGANHIAVIPYGFMRKDDPTVHYNPTGQQWWGERPEGVIKTIVDAHEHNIEVMLKPSIYMHGTWTGDAYYNNKADIETWQKGYTKYVMFFAELADSLNVDLFCIGNEFKQMTINQPKYWEGLISKVRKVYKGKLTYASNWDEYPKVTFWDQLDYIGINAYFPLSAEKKPSLKSLMRAWEPLEKKMKKISDQYNTPILFTEYGYLSLEGATHNTWELENKRESTDISEQVQALAYEALFKTFWDTDYWHGGYVWKWYPYEGRRASRRLRDYTPQGKKGEETLRTWFTR